MLDEPTGKIVTVLMPVTEFSFILIGNLLDNQKNL